MKILSVTALAIPEVKVITFQRFKDERGFFTEPFRSSQFKELDFFAGNEVVQFNQSFSHQGVIRGLHFQWNPYMGKLVRTIAGHMVDLVLDIRKGSPTEGKIIGYDMPMNPEAEMDQWIWVPPGFAHGNYFLEDSSIEYLCTGEYSPGNEAGISPQAEDLDWTLCDNIIRSHFERVSATAIISDKDLAGLSLAVWQQDVRSSEFMYGNI